MHDIKEVLVMAAGVNSWLNFKSALMSLVRWHRAEHGNAQSIRV
jgi:hypothetical protein